MSRDPIVEYQEGPLSAVYEAGVMLAGKPRERRPFRTTQLKVSSQSETPKNAATPGCVVVVEFDNPILLPEGYQQVSVAGQVFQTVGVQPVVGGGGQQHRRA